MKLFFLLALLFIRCSYCDCPPSCVFRDLALVELIDREIHDELPLFYNFSFIGGYFNMPSARMPSSGGLCLGAASIPPYMVYGANFAVFNRIELSANYRVFRGIDEKNFGKEGFGDDADRIGNVKFGILIPQDDFPLLPSIAFGVDDVIGTKRFGSHYFVATETWERFNFELSVGYGWGRLKGLFGGAAWTPFRGSDVPILQNVSFLAEYDANNYHDHHAEHFDGRSITSRFNGGISYILGNTLQLSLGSVRGEKIGGSLSLRFPLGSSQGIVPKINDPCNYISPMDLHPIGPIRPEKEFVFDLAYTFSDQGFDLYEAYLFYDCNFVKQLYIKIVNTRYRKESEVRERIQDVLAALTPANIASVKVVIEADGILSHSYCFRTCDLYRLRECCLSPWEIEVLAPKTDVACFQNPYEIHPLFERRRVIYTYTLRPRVVSFFGSTSGKFKYSLGLIGSVEGFLPGNVLYRFQGSYSAYSSVHGLTNRDRLNPSELLHVRTDAVKYYQEGRMRVDEFYLQRSWNLGRGWFFRLASGYFEPAYGGGATEILYYPVSSLWGVGVEEATLLKRQYSGIGFTHEVTRFNSQLEEVKVPFLGIQYFLNFYYDFKPLDLLFEVKMGQFLAKDKGAKIQVTRYFPSGAQFSLWLTLTNGNDKVNGRTYFDKGFAFHIPFDLFLKKSSRTFLTNGMSAWLRDIGAIAQTGKRLFPALYEERYD